MEEVTSPVLAPTGLMNPKPLLRAEVNVTCFRGATIFFQIRTQLTRWLLDVISDTLLEVVRTKDVQRQKMQVETICIEKYAIRMSTVKVVPALP